MKICAFMHILRLSTHTSGAAFFPLPAISYVWDPNVPPVYPANLHRQGASCPLIWPLGPSVVRGFGAIAFSGPAGQRHRRLRMRAAAFRAVFIPAAHLMKPVHGQFIFREIEKFVIRQPPTGEKDDYDSENSWTSDGLPGSSRRRRRGDGRWDGGEWRA